MSGKKQLGIFFGKKALSIVETNNQVPERFVSASHGMFEREPGTGQDLPDDVALTAIIQKSLREQKISSTEINLSLPTRDVIFRSFVIPWMQPSELRGVVEFEARKYIPFKLEELSYTHHAVTFEDKGNRKLRILFAAVRNDILEKYVQILTQAGLDVIFSEPAPMSLIRALMFRNQIPPNQRVAIVQANEREGRIIIVNEGLPHFIREFQFLPSTTPTSDIEPGVLNMRLFNEIRNSLSYYSRQYDQERIDGIITLSVDDSKDQFENLGKEMGIPTVSLSSNSILGTSSVVDIDLLNGFGIGLRSTVSLPADFNLSAKPLKGFHFSPESIDVRSLIKTALVGVFIIALTFILASGAAKEQKRKIALLEEKQQQFQGLTLQDIEQKNKEIMEKLVSYKKIPSQSSAAHFLSAIPNVLPQGTWLETLQITYSDDTFPKEKSLFQDKNQPQWQPKATLNLDGYVYQEDVNQQIRLINALVADLKNNQNFAPFFESIELVSAQTQTLDGYVVTHFRIACK